MKKLLFIFFISAFVANAQQKQILTPELLWKFNRISDIKVSPDGKQILYGISKYNVDENKGNRDLYIISINGGKATQLTQTPQSEFNALWRPDGKKIGYLSSESGSVQVWEMNPDGTDKKQISNITDGINGFSYSPTLNMIVFIKDIKLDLTVSEIHKDLPKVNAMMFDDLMYRHWDNWTDYAYSHVFYATYNNGTIGNAIDLMPNERFDSPLTPDGGMEQIAISPNGKLIAYTSRKLNGIKEAQSTNSDIYIYNIDTKTTENISEGMPGYDKNPVFSTDGNKIVWQSMKNPAYESDKERIWLFDLTSKKGEDLSINFDQTSNSFAWANNNTINFISGIKGTEQIFSIDVASKKVTQLTKGNHDITQFEIVKNELVYTKMSISLPTEIFKTNTIDNKETQLSFANKDLLNSIEFGKVEERWVTTTDGKKMLVWVILPPNFDKNKKYPALLYCQGGPQSTVSQFFSYRWNFQIMAANGYVVVAPNRRGLPSFGQEWNDQIALDYGGQNMKDYLSAIDSISNESYVDKSRLGAIGASYGGFSVYWLAGNHNKRFKAFIAHNGMFNFESWYGSTEELWFANHDLGGPYWNSPRPKSYDYSPHNYISNWDTPIMIVVGGKDFRIPYTQGMEAFQAAQIKGIPSKMLFFPEETHFVLKPQNSIFWQREFFKWLDKWLK